MTVWRKGPVVFDDIRFPLIGQRLTVSAGRLDYNFDECTVDFSATARYPDEPICCVGQMPHSKKMETEIRPHIHWVQEQNNTPNWLLAYRFYNNGGVIPPFTLAKYTINKFTYTSGAIVQLTEFPHILSPSGEAISAICDFILYRDSQDESDLFGSNDPYTATVKAKEFDAHVEIDSDGSIREYRK